MKSAEIIEKLKVLLGMSKPVDEPAVETETVETEPVALAEEEVKEETTETKEEVVEETPEELIEKKVEELRGEVEGINAKMDELYGIVMEIAERIRKTEEVVDETKEEVVEMSAQTQPSAEPITMSKAKEEKHELTLAEKLANLRNSNK